MVEEIIQIEVNELQPKAVELSRQMTDANLDAEACSLQIDWHKKTVFGIPRKPKRTKPMPRTGLSAVTEEE